MGMNPRVRNPGRGAWWEGRGYSVLLLALSACGSGTFSSSMGFDPAMPPTEDPLLTLPTVTGVWQISIWTAPQPPRKGSDDVMYRVSDNTGAPVDGLAIEVTPWMAAHGHGTTIPPVVTPLGEGRYLVRPTYLYMAGRWDLRTTIAGHTGTSTAGSATPSDIAQVNVDDSVVPAFDIP
jgi:YtkA-like